MNTVAAVFAFTSVFAQNPKKDRCGTTHWLKALESIDAAKVATAFETNSVKMESALQAKKAKAGSNQKQAATYTIPVVFHVVAPNPSAITDAQIMAQLDRLNKDWAGLNADTAQILSQFKSSLGKGNIQFCLAQRNPQNFPSTGIVRVTSNTQSDYDLGDPVKYTSSGGSDQWDPKRFINVWITVIGGTDGILGYATFPVGSGFPDAEQGVVIDYRTLPGGQSPYDLGRTLTHEMGHYFLLFHPWDPNGCNDSDFYGTPSITDDTPTQADETYGCPSGTVATGCTPGDPNGRNYQDFMDYVNDACMHMFTKGQMQRAEAALLGLRSELTSSNGCVPPNAVSNNASITAIVNPTAANSLCSSSAIGVVTLLNAGNNTLNSVVFNIVVNGTYAGAVNWNGSLAPFTSQNVTLPAIVFPNAVNSLTIYTTNPNGSPDAVPSNDTAKTTITVAPRVMVPYLQGFESSVFPPAGWDRIQTPSDAVTWQRTTAASKNGLASAFIDNYNYGNFSGRKDDLVTPIFNFSDVDSVFIKFDIAAARYYDAAQTQNLPPDTLEIAVTKDCGTTWNVVYKKWDTVLITTNNFGTDTTYFIPKSNQWRTDSVNITGITGTQGEFRVRIRNIENWGNNIYIDNFRVYTKILPAKLKAEGVLITPNPVLSTLYIQHLLPPVDLQGITIMNAAGQVVHRQQFFRTALTYIPINIAHLTPGVYSVRLDYADKKVNQKFLKL